MSRNEGNCCGRVGSSWGGGRVAHAGLKVRGCWACTSVCHARISSQEMQVEELSAVRQTLQADLETSIRRIVDLQAALEEVESSDESDAER